MSIWLTIHTGVSLLAEAARGWQKDNGPRLGAALAYYTLFSIAPLLVVAIAVAGLAFGQEAAPGRIVAELNGLLGQAGARALEEAVDNSRHSAAGIMATLGAFLTLFLGATGVFGELKGALNVVWDVRDDRPQPGFIVGLLRNRLWSFAMVLAVGFLLLVSLLVSALLAAAQGALAPYLPSRRFSFRAQTPWRQSPRSRSCLPSSSSSFRTPASPGETSGWALRSRPCSSARANT
jgi:membrane protein